MDLFELKDEIQEVVQKEYRKVIEDTINHFGIDKYLGLELSTEDLVEYATNQYVKRLGSKIINWSKQAGELGKNGRS